MTTPTARIKERPTSNPNVAAIRLTEITPVAKRVTITSSITQRKAQEEATVQTAKTAAPAIDTANNPG